MTPIRRKVGLLQKKEGTAEEGWTSFGKKRFEAVGVISPAGVGDSRGGRGECPKAKKKTGNHYSLVSGESGEKKTGFARGLRNYEDMANYRGRFPFLRALSRGKTKAWGPSIPKERKWTR